jgi:zinc protease
MSVFSRVHRHRFSFIVLSVWLIVMFLLNHDSAVSHKLPHSTQGNHQESLVSTTTTQNHNVQKTVLANGLTVLTKEVHTAPVVSVQMWYKVGSRDEAVGINGITHQLEHMMFKGTNSRPIQFGRLFNALGSDSNAFTYYDQTAYYNTAEREKLPALLVLEADRMQNLLINREKLESEKQVVISELQGYENNPEYRLNRAIMRALFPKHPYGLPVGGTKADVKRFTVEQVKKYYQEFYSPDRAVLVIVGDFQTAPTLNRVREVFGKIANHHSSPVSTAAAPPVSTSPSTVVLKEPGTNPLLEVVYPVPNIKEPDIPALSVMDYILTSGKNSYLYHQLVESGLASDVTASLSSLRAGGWYDISITPGLNQDLQNIEAGLMRAIAQLVEKGITLDQVERAKTQILASVVLNSRDINSQGMQLGTDETTTDDYLYTERYLDGIRQVQAADVIQVINKYLRPETRVVGRFEPTQPESKSAAKSTPSLTQEKFAGGAPLAPAEMVKYLPQVEESNSQWQLNTPQQYTFANGLRLLLLPDKSTPTVALRGYIKAGPEFDPKNKGGLAALVADNLMNGTTSKDMLTIAKALEDRGANLEFAAYREGVRIKGVSLASDLQVLLETLTDVVKNSTFPVKELELSRQQALTSLYSELDDPDKVANRTFLQSIYPQKHPLHNLPTEESIQQISHEDVIDFKQKHYRPDTTVLALVGDFDVEKVRSLIQAQLGDWPVQGKPPDLTYPTVNMPEKVVNLNPVLPGKVQAITYMGYSGIKRQDPRFYAAMILNQILGGDTLSSRLGAEVRDRQGLTYGIYSNFLASKNTGTFLIEMQTSPEDTSKAIASTRKLLQQIHQQGVTNLEVDLAKRTLISNYNVSLADPEQLTHRILMNEVFGLDEKELFSFSQKIEQVTLSQVNQAARELLHPDKIVVVTAGPQVAELQSIR